MLEIKNKIEHWLKETGVDLSDGIVLAISPQLQLTPYVYSILNYFGFLYKKNIIFIHDSTSSQAGYFSRFPNVLQINQGEWSADYENASKVFFDALDQLGVKISFCIAHNFAHNANRPIVRILRNRIESMAEGMPVKVIFYSDGSRNNPCAESSGHAIDGDLQSMFSSQHKSFVNFGFVHHTNTIACDSLTIDYGYMGSFYSHGYRRALENPDLVEKSDVLVLTRYVGKGPYKFKNNSRDGIADGFLQVLKLSFPDEKTFSIRSDDRFLDITSRLVQRSSDYNLSISLFEAAYQDRGSIADVLFEQLCINNPELLGKYKIIFCFDSSFPLVFLNKNLYRILPPNTKIVLGFPSAFIRDFGSAEFCEVAKKRTVETLYSVINLSLFNVFCNGKAVDVNAGIESLESLYDSFGLFELRKP